MIKFERTLLGHVFLPEPDFDRPLPGERVVRPVRKKRGDRRA